MHNTQAYSKKIDSIQTRERKAKLLRMKVFILANFMCLFKEIFYYNWERERKNWKKKRELKYRKVERSTYKLIFISGAIKIFHIFIYVSFFFNSYMINIIYIIYLRGTSYIVRCVWEKEIGPRGKKMFLTKCWGGVYALQS